LPGHHPNYPSNPKFSKQRRGAHLENAGTAVGCLAPAKSSLSPRG
jgi:hypothetical protein